MLPVERDERSGIDVRLRRPIRRVAHAGPVAYCAALRPNVWVPAGLILLVEDNSDSRGAIEHFLRLHGFDVAVALDGEDALQSLRGGLAPCLILLDVMMPRKDAHAFRGEQLADPALARIPVVVFSGAYDVGGIAERLGVRDYLTKPVDVQRLLDKVRRYCGDVPQP